MLPFELTKDTPYLALSGELWSVFYEYFNRNWACYKGFLLYMIDPVPVNYPKRISVKLRHTKAQQNTTKYAPVFLNELKPKS